MKTIKILVLALMLPTLASAAKGMPETMGIAWDKMLHFSAGYIVADLQGRLEEDGMEIHDKYQIGPLLAAIALGAGKEWFDSQEGGTGWDNMDWLATSLGGGFRVTIHVNWFRGARIRTGYYDSLEKSGEMTHEEAEAARKVDH